MSEREVKAPCVPSVETQPILPFNAALIASLDSTEEFRPSCHQLSLVYCQVFV